MNDDELKKLLESDIPNEIDDTCNSKEILRKCKEKSKRRRASNFKRSLVMAGIFIASIISLGIFLFNDNQGNVNKPTDIIDDKEKKIMESFNNKDELMAYLKEISSSSNEIDSEGNYCPTENWTFYCLPSISPNPNAQPSMTIKSQDDSDIVAVKDNHIFFLTMKDSMNAKCYMFTSDNGELVVSKELSFTKTTNEMEIIDDYEVSLVTETYPDGLFVTDKYLVVRARKCEYKTKHDLSGEYEDFDRIYDFGYTCLFQIYDIKSLELVNVAETAGSNVVTYLVDNVLYVVNNYNDFYRNLNNFYYYPYYYIGDHIFFPKIGCVYYTKDVSVSSYASVYKIDLSDEIKVEDLHILTSDIINVYLINHSLFLSCVSGYEIVDEEKQIINSINQIVVLSIDNNLEINGTFNVKGAIRENCIDEKDGIIRVASTGVYGLTNNLLSFFKKTENGYEECGVIAEGIGKEKDPFRRVFFYGDLVTIVTYDASAPLYYVDISDYQNPVFSTSKDAAPSVFQCLYKDKYVVSFAGGVQVSLFDIGDKQNIKQIGQSTIDVTTREYIEISSDKKYEIVFKLPYFYDESEALFIDEDLGIFGFRITGEKHYLEIVEPYSFYTENYDQSKYVSKYLLFKIDENSEEPITVVTLIEEEEPYRIQAGDDYIYYKKEALYQRFINLGEKYYLLSSTKVNIYGLIDNQFVEEDVLMLD